MRALFEKYKDEFCKWKCVHPQLSHRADIHAFILLNHLVPGRQNMVSGTEHDKIYLGIDPDKLAKVVTEKQVIELIRCGVMFEDDHLCMFT